MRRLAHGPTKRPPVPRPGNGYGRPVRPGPDPRWRQTAAEARRRNDTGLGHPVR
jgi:hypothetical protein